MKDAEAPFVNPANIITLFRVILIPFFLITLFGQSFRSLLAALLIFTIASLSDFFDGLIARRCSLHTRFGEYADPLADKLLVGSAFVAFLFFPFLRIPVWLVVLIFIREILVTIMRSVAIRRGEEMKTEFSGKVKTFFQMSSVFILLSLIVLQQWVSENVLSGGSAYEAGFWAQLLGERGASFFNWFPVLLVSISALLALISLVHYLVNNWCVLTKRDNSGNGQ